MAIPIVKADLEARVGAGEVARYSHGHDAEVTEAIAQAWDSARSAALNYFTAASWDALTSGTLPPEAKRHLVSDAIDLLSAGSNRPDYIGTKSEEAKEWRSWLAADRVRSFDAVLARRDDAAEDGGDVTYQLPARKFNREENDYWNIPERD